MNIPCHAMSGFLEKYSFEKISTNICPQLVGTWVKEYFQELGPIFFDMSSTSGNMGANISRNVVPDFRQAAGGISTT